MALSLQVQVLRLLVAGLLGALVGMQRERSEHMAGMRTHALVAAGSSLVIIVSAYGFAGVLGQPGVALDPSRIAAQVVSGIGFLGAGTILVRGATVRGLTTAASIWFVAAIGLACGAGLFGAAAAATVLELLILWPLKLVEQRLFHRASGIAISLRRGKEDAPAVRDALRESGLPVSSIDISPEVSSDRVAIQLAVSDLRDAGDLIDRLRAIPGVQHVTIMPAEPEDERE